MDIHLQVRGDAAEAQLKGLIEAHHTATGSPKASRILDDWSKYLPKFWQLVPPSEAESAEAGATSTAEAVLA